MDIPEKDEIRKLIIVRHPSARRIRIARRWNATRDYCADLVLAFGLGVAFVLGVWAAGTATAAAVLAWAGLAGG